MTKKRSISALLAAFPGSEVVSITSGDGLLDNCIDADTVSAIIRWNEYNAARLAGRLHEYVDAHLIKHGFPPLSRPKRQRQKTTEMSGDLFADYQGGSADE